MLCEGGKGAHLCFPGVCHRSWDITGVGHKRLGQEGTKEWVAWAPGKEQSPAASWYMCVPADGGGGGGMGTPASQWQGPLRQPSHEPQTQSTHPNRVGSNAVWRDHALQRGWGQTLEDWTSFQTSTQCVSEKLRKSGFPLTKTLYRTVVELASYLKKQTQSFCDANKLPLMCVWQIQGKSSFS